MNSPAVRFILRYASVFARFAVGAVFLSNVADRLGLWGPAGTNSVAWGNLENYYDSVRALNPYLPELLVPVVGWGVNVAEVVLAVMLIVGFKARWAGLISGVLMLVFGLANAVNFGIKVPLNYSIFSASAAALLIATQRDLPFSIDALRSTARRSAARPTGRAAAAVFFLILLTGCGGMAGSTSSSAGSVASDLVDVRESV